MALVFQIDEIIIKYSWDNDNSENHRLRRQMAMKCDVWDVSAIISSNMLLAC